jgi:SAM-dependent methyltransferase
MVVAMTTYDFGYSWIWTHGHLVPLGLFGGVAAIALWRRWPRWTAAISGAVGLWALAGFLVVQLVLNINRPIDLPTETFLQSGSGRVLDVGAGSGRSTLMVLRGRPCAQVTALDIYRGYYGIDDNTPERIRRNARVAGVEDQLQVVTGDMRDMPLPDGEFDAVVSAFAIDHLSRDGVARSLAEVARVLRPGGEFLLMIINVDAWIRLAYPLPHGHGYFSEAQNADRWRAALATAGLDVVEQGSDPGTLYFLARRGGLTPNSQLPTPKGGAGLVLRCGWRASPSSFGGRAPWTSPTA